MSEPSVWDELRQLHEKSTKVTAWYPHAGGDCYGPEATVRGPFFRWLRVQMGDPKHQNMVAHPDDDAKYVAAAMNATPKLLDEVTALEARVALLEGALKEAREALVFYSEGNAPNRFYRSMDNEMPMREWVDDSEQLAPPLGTTAANALASLDKRLGEGG